MDESSSSTTTTSMLYCDPNGQAIGEKGTIDPNQAGTYTSIMRLASQLDDIGQSSSSSSSSSQAQNKSQQQKEKSASSNSQQPTTSTSSGNSSNNNNNNPKSLSSLWSSSSSKRPLISVETDQFVTLIKAYGDHTVVMKVPTSTGGDNDDAIPMDQQKNIETSGTGGGGMNDSKHMEYDIGVVGDDSSGMDGDVANTNSAAVPTATSVEAKGDDPVVDVGGE